MSCFVFRVWGLGFGVSVLGFGVWGFGFGVSGFGFRVSGFGVGPAEEVPDTPRKMPRLHSRSCFEVEGLGLRVYGLRFTVYG